MRILLNKYFLILLLSIFFLENANAKKDKRTWDYPLDWYKKFEVVGSKDFFEFKFDLLKDEDVIREIKNNQETGVIGYLLYEDGKIIIDESDMPTHARKGGAKIINGLLPG